MNILNRASGSKKKARAVRRKFEDFKGLSITSLLDILTIILVFLIKNVSTEAAIIAEEKGMTYPSTITNDELMKKSGVTPVKLFLDKVVLGNESLEFGTPQELYSDPQKRENIYNYLTLEANTIIKAGNEPCLVVQADEYLPCDYVSEIVKVGTSAGFTNIYFATLEDAEWLSAYAANLAR